MLDNLLATAFCFVRSEGSFNSPKPGHPHSTLQPRVSCWNIVPVCRKMNLTPTTPSSLWAFVWIHSICCSRYFFGGTVSIDNLPDWVQRGFQREEPSRNTAHKSPLTRECSFVLTAQYILYFKPGGGLHSVPKLCRCDTFICTPTLHLRAKAPTENTTPTPPLPCGSAALWGPGGFPRMFSFPRKLVASISPAVAAADTRHSADGVTVRVLNDFLNDFWPCS